jgi:hypothetical protein
VQQLRLRKRAEAERMLEMERRQKRRLEEIWETQKKVMNHSLSFPIFSIKL